VKTKAGITAALLAIALSTPAAERAPSLETVIPVLQAGAKPERAMESMRRIWSTDRWFTFPKFGETVLYLKGAMQTAGLEQVEIIDAPADGKTQVGFWTMPLAWDVRSARLEIIEPDAPEDARILADYQKVPASLGMWSASTSAGGVVAQIVDAGETGAEEIQQRDIRGKLVLTSKNPADLKWALARGGALGAINAFSENPKLDNGRQWINAWGDNGWAFTAESCCVSRYLRSRQRSCASCSPAANRCACVRQSTAGTTAAPTRT
jgi:hypothetical protein